MTLRPSYDPTPTPESLCHAHCGTNITSKPQKKITTKSSVKQSKSKETRSVPQVRESLSIRSNNSICLDIPKISYKQFKKPINKPKVTEHMYFKNTFYFNPRAKIILYTKEKYPNNSIELQYSANSSARVRRSTLSSDKKISNSRGKLKIAI